MDDFKALLAAADQIKDPVERQKEYDRLSRLMLGTESPARAATAPVVLPKPSPAEDLIRRGFVNKTPLAEQKVHIRSPQEEEAIRHGVEEDAALNAKLQPIREFGGGEQPQRLAAFSDDELMKLAGGFDGDQTAKAAQEEILARGRIDSKGLSRVFDPTYINRLAGNVVGGAANLLTSGPITLAGLMALGGEKVTGADLGAGELLGLGENVREGVNKRIGISEPRDIGESAAGILPSILPVPGMKAPAGLLKNVAEVVTPLTIGAGGKRVLANFATAAVADQGIRELSDTGDDKYKTITDVAGITGGPTDKADPAAALNIAAGLGVLLSGTLITPAIAKAYKTYRSPKIPQIEDVTTIDAQGPKGLKTLERSGDQLKTFIVDEKSVLADLYRRAGAPDLNTVSRLIDNDTHIAAVMRVNEAMRTGRLNTYGGRWQVSTTPSQLKTDYTRLPIAMQKDVDDFLKYHDFMDDLKLQIKYIAQLPNVNLNDVMTKLGQTRAAIQIIGNRTPIAQEFARRYRDVTASVRSFLTQGPNAMLSSRSAAKLGQSRANWVPANLVNIDPRQNLLRRIVDAQGDVSQKKIDAWYQQKRSLGDVTSIEGRGNSIDALIDWTHNALRAKMEHDVRGAYVRGMGASNYGSDTMRLATSKERQKYPDRLVYVYENGKRKAYLSSRLQGNLLNFDPYVAKYPRLYGLKRLWELGTTGPVSLTFAPVTAFRDSVGGWITMPKGFKGPTPLGTAVAIPKILWAKAQLATMDMLGKNFEHLPFFTPQTKQMLAHQVSNAYMNSYYHMASQAGGVDASLLQSSIENAQGVMAQIGKTIQQGTGQLPASIRWMGQSPMSVMRGFRHIFNAVSEGPRFSAFERTVKAGKSPTEAVAEVRKLTGDNTRSGRVYDPRGKMIGVDAVNKGATVANPLIGSVAEMAREGIPYVNATVQGLRRVGEAFIRDPVGSNLKAWTAIGLPSLVMMGWNEMLGDEYNKYAYQERTSRDISNNLYIGVPGLPPDRGLQIPIPIEFQLWKSPFETALYSLMKGADGDEVQAMMQHMAATSLSNAALVGFPQMPSMILAGARVHAPDSINPFSWKDSVYDMREDNVGLFPQNIEALFRSTFGGITDTVLMSAAAFHKDDPSAFFKEMLHQVAKRTPIVKNLTGNTPPVSQFTPQSEIDHGKITALQDFTDMYDAYVEKGETVNKTGMASSKGQWANEGNDADTNEKLAPMPMPVPDNPLVFMYGPAIKDILDGNAEGYDGLKSHYKVVTKQLQLLKTYTAGSAASFKEYQKTYLGANKKYQAAVKPITDAIAAIPMGPDGKAVKGYGKKLIGLKKDLRDLNSGLGEAAKADRLINEAGLDLSKRGDVMKLISILERERGEISGAQIKMINNVEDRINQDLASKGLLANGQKFSILKHLGPSTPQGLLNSQATVPPAQ